MHKRTSDNNQQYMDISIELENKLIEIIDKLAENQNISRDEFINQCIALAMENIDDSKR